MKPHGGQRGFQVLITANDAVTTLDASYEKDLVLTGTGVLQVYDLGNATGYRVGRQHFIFYNNTAEFVGVQNSDGTVWKRVPPGARCVCVLISNAAAAGVWSVAVHEENEISRGHTLRNEFVGRIGASSPLVSSSGDLLLERAIGVSGNVAQSNPIIAGHEGMLLFETVNNAAGMGGVYADYSGFIFGDGARSYETSLALDTDLSTAAQEYIIRTGIFNSTTHAAITDGVYFMYDRAGSGVNWRLVHQQNPNTTNVDSGVVVAAAATPFTWYRMRFEIASLAGRTDWWINSVQVSAAGGITTNIPVGAAMNAVNMGIRKSVGATSRYFRADYVQKQWYPLSLR